MDETRKITAEEKEHFEALLAYINSGGEVGLMSVTYRGVPMTAIVACERQDKSIGIIPLVLMIDDPSLLKDSRGLSPEPLATSEQATSERATSEQATSERATSEQATSERATSERATSERATDEGDTSPESPVTEH